MNLSILLLSIPISNNVIVQAREKLKKTRAEVTFRQYVAFSATINLHMKPSAISSYRVNSRADWTFRPKLLE